MLNKVTKVTTRCVIFKLQKAKDKEKVLKETRQGKNTIPVEEQRKIKLDIATEYKKRVK